MPGKLQLDLYAAVQDLLLDRIVWFLRNVDLAKGLADVVDALSRRHRRGRRRARRRAVGGGAARRARRAAASLTSAGVPDELAGRIADLGALAAAPDIVLVADRTGKPVAEVAATYFAAGSFLPSRPHCRRGAAHPDRRLFRPAGARPRARSRSAMPNAGSRAAMVANGAAGAGAVEAWVAPRKGEVERIRGAIHEIANSGPDAVEALAWPPACLGDLVKN